MRGAVSCAALSRSEKELQPKLHRAAAATKLVIDQELGRGHERIRRAEWVRISSRIERAIVAWQPDTEVVMIENVERFRAELQREALGHSNVLEHRHVPDVQTRCGDGVAADVGHRAN